MPHFQRPARQKLIDAAYPLFLEHGYNGAGLAEILRNAHFSKGGFYHHFESKLDLLAAVAKQALPVPFKDLDWAAHRAKNGPEQEAVIRQVYSAASAGFHDLDGDVMRYFALFFDALAHLPNYRAAVDRAFAQVISALAAAYAREGHAAPDEHARSYIAAFEGEIFLRAVTSRKEIT